MKSINLSTTVNYGDFTKTAKHRFFNAIEDYFYLSGRKAYVIKDRNKNGLYEVELKKTEKQHILLTVLKIISYFTVVIPLLMAIARTTHRITHRFTLPIAYPLARASKVTVEQDRLLNKCTAYMQKQKDCDHEFVETFKSNGGHCNGLGAAFLYALWTTFNTTKKGGHLWNMQNDLEWWEKSVAAITNWNEKKALSDEEKFYFESFLSFVEQFQNPQDHLNLLQREYDGYIQDTDDRNLRQEYTLAGAFAHENLEKLLEKITIKEDRWISINADKHNTVMMKHGDTYYFYDSNNPNGYVKTKLLSYVSEQITKAYPKLRDAGSILFTIRIFSFDDPDSAAYPSQSELFQELGNHDFAAQHKDKLMHAGIDAGCLESFLCHFDESLINTTDKKGYSLLKRARINRARSIIDFLISSDKIDSAHVIEHLKSYTTPALTLGIDLKKYKITKQLLEDPDVDPNEQVSENDHTFTALHYAIDQDMFPFVDLLLQHPETDPNLTFHPLQYTPLMRAIMLGASLEIIQSLINDPRADLERKDAFDRTALDLARNTGRHDVVALIESL